jgi:signal transduction histidine kinase
MTGHPSNHPGDRRTGSMTSGLFTVKIFAVDGSGHPRTPAPEIRIPDVEPRVPKREIPERIDGRLAVAASTPSNETADPGRERDAVGDHRTTRSQVLSRRDFQALQARTPRALTAVSLADERHRWERDLHDGVQNELVALIIKLALVQEDTETPPALVEVLAGLEARAQAALDSVRNIARGIYPPLLADFGLERALRAQVARAAVDVSLEGTAPRSTEAAEQAVYFASSEAIQNAAKYAGCGTRVTLELRHHHGSLTVRIADDGRGLDPAGTSNGAGLQNIRDRIEPLGGLFRIASSPGHGTILTISLPWPAAAGRPR